MIDEDKQKEIEKKQRKLERYKKIKKFIIWGLITSILLIGVYIVLRILVKRGIIDEAIFWSKFQDWAIIAIVIVVGIYIIVQLFSKLFDKKKENENENIKEYVDAIVAQKVFTEEFVKGTNIPYFYNPNLKEIQTYDPFVVKIRNEQTFPERITGTPFYMFECIAKKGTRRGINLVVIRLDKGVEHIRNNWVANIKEHTPEEIYSRNERKYPYATPQDENARLEVYRQQQLEEGVREQQLTHLESLRLTAKNQPQPEIPEELIELQKEKFQLEALEKMQKSQK